MKEYSNKKVLFLGGVFLPGKEKEIIKNTKGQAQNAANSFQWKIIEGLDNWLLEPTTIVNSIFIGSFPRYYKKLFIKKEDFNHSNKENHKDYNLSFLNLPFVKHVSKYNGIKKCLKKKVNLKEYDVVVGYIMTNAIVQGLNYAKKLNPNLKTCLIVPDLPEFMNLSGRRNFIFDCIKKRNNKVLYKQIQKIDNFVVLTKAMAEALHVEDKSIVVEGVVSSNGLKNSTKKENKKDIKRLVYTGTLDQKYGVKDLVDAFIEIPQQDVELIVCGEGNTREYILEKSKQDERVKFKGLVCQEEAMELQRNAYLLINPRNSKEEYTKYSFPSKTMEYMLSGVPVLMYKLDGIPDEYDDYLYYINETENGLKESLLEVLNIPKEELQKKGENAQNFVLENKNNLVQTKKILDMIL